MTCDITLTVAEIAYGRPTVVARYADGQMPFYDAVKVAVAEGKVNSRVPQASARHGEVTDAASTLPALETRHGVNDTPAPAL